MHFLTKLVYSMIGMLSDATGATSQYDIEMDLQNSRNEYAEVGPQTVVHKGVEITDQVGNTEVRVFSFTQYG